MSHADQSPDAEEDAHNTDGVVFPPIPLHEELRLHPLSRVPNGPNGPNVPSTTNNSTADLGLRSINLNLQIPYAFIFQKLMRDNSALVAFLRSVPTAFLLQVVKEKEDRGENPNEGLELMSMVQRSHKEKKRVEREKEGQWMSDNRIEAHSFGKNIRTWIEGDKREIGILVEQSVKIIKLLHSKKLSIFPVDQIDTLIQDLLNAKTIYETTNTLLRLFNKHVPNMSHIPVEWDVFIGRKPAKEGTSSELYKSGDVMKESLQKKTPAWDSKRLKEFLENRMHIQYETWYVVVCGLQSRLLLLLRELNVLSTFRNVWEESHPPHSQTPQDLYELNKKLPPLLPALQRAIFWSRRLSQVSSAFARAVGALDTGNMDYANGYLSAIRPLGGLQQFLSTDLDSSAPLSPLAPLRANHNDPLSMQKMSVSIEFADDERAEPLFQPPKGEDVIGTISLGQNKLYGITIPTPTLPSSDDSPLIWYQPTHIKTLLARPNPSDIFKIQHAAYIDSSGADSLRRQELEEQDESRRQLQDIVESSRIQNLSERGKRGSGVESFGDVRNLVRAMEGRTRKRGPIQDFEDGENEATAAKKARFDLPEVPPDMPPAQAPFTLASDTAQISLHAIAAHIPNDPLANVTPRVPALTAGAPVLSADILKPLPPLQQVRENVDPLAGVREAMKRDAGLSARIRMGGGWFGNSGFGVYEQNGLGQQQQQQQKMYNSSGGPFNTFGGGITTGPSSFGSGISSNFSSNPGTSFASPPTFQVPDILNPHHFLQSQTSNVPDIPNQTSQNQQLGGGAVLPPQQKLQQAIARMRGRQEALFQNTMQQQQQQQQQQVLPPTTTLQPQSPPPSTLAEALGIPPFVPQPVSGMTSGSGAAKFMAGRGSIVGSSSGSVGMGQEQGLQRNEDEDEEML